MRRAEAAARGSSAVAAAPVEGRPRPVERALGRDAPRGKDEPGGLSTGQVLALARPVLQEGDERSAVDCRGREKGSENGGGEGIPIGHQRKPRCGEEEWGDGGRREGGRTGDVRCGDAHDAPTAAREGRQAHAQERLPPVPDALGIELWAEHLKGICWKGRTGTERRSMRSARPHLSTALLLPDPAYCSHAHRWGLIVHWVGKFLQQV